MSKFSSSTVLVLAAAVAGAAVGCSGAQGGPKADRNAGAPGRQLVTGRYIASTRPEGGAGATTGPSAESVLRPELFAGVVRTAVGSMPSAVAMTADRKFAVVTTRGFRQSLSVIEVATGRLVSQVAFNKAPGTDPVRGLYHGVVVSGDGTVYAAQGGRGSVAVLSLSAGGELRETGVIEGGKADFIAGLALDGRGVLFATSNEPARAGFTPINSPGAVIAFDTGTGKELGRYEFASPVGTTNYPLAAAVTADGKRLFVGSQRDNAVYVFDASDPAKLKLEKVVATGVNPAALLLDEARGTLFVANADSDTVSFVDVKTLKVEVTLPVRPTAARDLPVASPIGLGLTPDGKTLYVALGEMNAVAVVDVPEAELEGFVPAGWFPTAVATDGKRLVTVNGKGTTTRNPKPPEKAGSPLNLIEGDVLTRDVPRRAELPALSAAAVELARVTPADFRQGNPLAHVGVEHVIYIVKENRTYDQVLGDLPRGNADPSYTTFGRQITPNLHALAERFVQMDNFYDCGDVSGDGWTWSTQAMANEYVTRNVPYSYSGRGRVYDYEGSNNGYPTGGFPAKWPDGRAMSEHPAFKDGGPAVRDVAKAPGGALWDLCAAHGVSFRNYGFFMSAAGELREAEGATTRTSMAIPDNYPSAAGLQPGGYDLAGRTNLDYRRYDLSFADSDAPENYYRATGDERFLYPTRTYGRHKMPSRVSEFRREFELMLKKDPTGGAVPKMMFVRFGNDHTLGMREGRQTPRAMVADNDYAVGQLVELISHSPVWGKTAIFVIEDDAQNGPDHVDTHRSICFVISPWVKRGTLESSFHNTVSCIRTMELLLGLPPMNANDAAARPMMFFDKAASNAEPYKAILPDPNVLVERVPSRRRGPARGNAPEVGAADFGALDPRIVAMIERSNAMDFEHADKAPVEELNRIIWASVHGLDSEMPATPTGPVNRAAVGGGDGDD